MEPVKRPSAQEKLLQRRDTAMLSLNQANQLYINDTTTKDTSFNDDFVKRTHAVDLKLDECSAILGKVCERIPKVGREGHVLPILHDFYQITHSMFSMCVTEACRLGILKRRIHVDSMDKFTTVTEMAALVHSQY